MPHKYKQVDVFTKVPLKGNAVAVFFDTEDLSTEEMQQIANWTNLAETTFVSKPSEGSGADYKVRIFTPLSELPFAGHPTLGTCFALLESKLVTPTNGKLVQECKAGLVTISVADDGVLTFDLLKESIEDVSAEAIAAVAEALGISQDLIVATPQVLNVGPRWLVTPLKDSQTILNLQPDLTKVAKLSSKYNVTGIQTFGPEKEKGVLESRTFAPFVGVNEDFACGSGTGAIGAFIRNSTTLKSQLNTNEFIVNQGAKVSRDAEIRLAFSDEYVKVGGHAVTCFEGTAVV